jgi:hypothetical protein
MYVVYGLDTKSIEDAEQCVVIYVPNDEADSPEAMESWLEDHGDEGISIQTLVNLISMVKDSRV